MKFLMDLLVSPVPSMSKQLNSEDPSPVAAFSLKTLQVQRAEHRGEVGFPLLTLFSVQDL